MNVFNAIGDVYSGVYHGVTGDFTQVSKDAKKLGRDAHGIIAPRTAEEQLPDVQAPVVAAAPVAVDDAALALRRQRLLASSYGRSQTILDQPAASSSLGGSAGATQLGG